MAKISFYYKGKVTLIECNINDKIKEIIDKYILRDKANNNLNFIYNGRKINKDLKFIELANELDIERKEINISVYDNSENNINIETQFIIKSKEIICPECKENILINIKDYRINLSKCKNNHIRNNILLEEYDNTQKIDLSKVKCDNCKNNNKDKASIKEFYICNSCDIQLCKKCRELHDNSHNIIYYNDKNYVCKKHNKDFIKYCRDCKENLCKLCGNEHKNHNIFNFQDVKLKLNKDELIKENEEFKIIIDKLKINIEEIKNILDRVLNNIQIINNINEDIINHYNEKKTNYYILNNINTMKDFNKYIIKDVNNI